MIGLAASGYVHWDLGSAIDVLGFRVRLNRGVCGVPR